MEERVAAVLREEHQRQSVDAGVRIIYGSVMYHRLSDTAISQAMHLMFILNILYTL